MGKVDTKDIAQRVAEQANRGGLQGVKRKEATVPGPLLRRDSDSTG
jgi:hypothetical protein